MSFPANMDRYSNNRGMVPLTMEQIRHAAPSVFAAEKHDSRSSRYTYIPTSAIVERMMGEGFLPFKASQSIARDETRDGYTKHMVRFRHQKHIERVARVGDSIPEVVVVNAHDGSAAYQLFIGAFRFICENGLMVADSLVGSLRVPHKGNIVDRVIEGSFEIIDQADRVLDVSQQWQQLQLTNGEQQAYARAAHEIRFGEPEVVDGEYLPHPIEPQKLLTPRRYDDKGNDLWSTFNRVQENVMRGGLRGRRFDPQTRKSRRVSTREVKGIDQDVRLNRALWTLTTEMAKLKGAAPVAA